MYVYRLSPAQFNTAQYSPAQYSPAQNSPAQPQPASWVRLIASRDLSKRAPDRDLTNVTGAAKTARHDHRAAPFLSRWLASVRRAAEKGPMVAASQGRAGYAQCSYRGYMKSELGVSSGRSDEWERESG